MKITPHAEGRVAGTGLYRMPAAIYHADPSPAPSLSSSIAKILIDQSPAHAHAAHPRLGKTGVADSDPTRAKEIGSAAHKLILGQGAEIVAIDADDYRTKAAKEARASACEDGKLPILASDLRRAERLANYADDRLASIPDCEGFHTAPAELVGIVQDPSGAWLRIMMDRFEDRGSHAVIWDVKTGDQPAAPHLLGRRIEGMGMEVQAALYVRAVELLIPRLAGRVCFRWIFIENDLPHAVTVAEADSVTLGIGARKLALALSRWNSACRTDQWPGYPARIVHPEYPGWAEQRWLEREAEPDLAPVDWDLAASPNRPFTMETVA
ncbi:PD-(D/E)XK nuclease family protein [Methylobacterium aquaticum]|uniref:PD-(D/E)XK nuclease family protein n=1 Tax=Methylobacterium aquaticum TaxID=270351 RepID=UPI003D172278